MLNPWYILSEDNVKEFTSYAWDTLKQHFEATYMNELLKICLDFFLHSIGCHAIFGMN